jgi:hypothetical protein
MIQPRKKSGDGSTSGQPAPGAAAGTQDPLLQPLLQARPNTLQRSNSSAQRSKSTQAKRTAVSPAIDLRRGSTLASAAVLKQVRAWCVCVCVCVCRASVQGMLPGVCWVTHTVRCRRTKQPDAAVLLATLIH